MEESKVQIGDVIISNKEKSRNRLHSCHEASLNNGKVLIRR